MIVIVYAFLLALASSTDNFCLGFGMGLTKRPLRVSTNVLISFCNSLGAYVAASWGTVASSFSMLASLAFFGLAVQEYISNGDNVPVLNDSGGPEGAGTPSNPGNHDGYNSKSKPPPEQRDASPVMAIPMTLNNLVGGVAGGMVGITPGVALLSALVASYTTMAVGHELGKRTSSTVAETYHLKPSRLSATLFALLGLFSLVDAFV
jgi:putative Mn2+ efflux pump MntP